MKRLKNFDPSKSKFIPRNTHKYLGDIDNIIFRSSWELRAFEFLDNNKNVIGWVSEEIQIPYNKPIISSNGGMTYKPAIYYPDLYVEYIDKSGNLIKEVIEIKPKKQTRSSRARNYSTKFVEDFTYIINCAKFEAADNWCKQRGIKFSILTENSLFL